MELTVVQVYDTLHTADLPHESFTNTYSGRGMSHGLIALVSGTMGN